MQLKAKHELDELALEFCRQKVAQELRGEFQVEIFNSDDEWDETYLRYMHNADLNIWKRIGEFVVFIDDDDCLAGFINPLAENGCQPVGLSSEQVDHILKNHSMFTEHQIELLDVTSETNGLIIARAVLRKDSQDELVYVLRINPVSKELVSAIPENAEGYENE